MSKTTSKISDVFSENKDFKIGDLVYYKDDNIIEVLMVIQKPTKLTFFKAVLVYSTSVNAFLGYTYSISKDNYSKFSGTVTLESK